MKHFLIRYRLKSETADAWHHDIVTFISALQGDGVLKSSISYRCLKVRDGVDYYHLASAVDDRAIKALQERDFSNVIRRGQSSLLAARSRSYRSRSSPKPIGPQ